MNTVKITHTTDGSVVTVNGHTVPEGFTYRLRTAQDGRQIVELLIVADRLSVEGETYGRDINALREKCGCAP